MMLQDFFFNQIAFLIDKITRLIDGLEIANWLIGPVDLR